jgi:flagellar export protein FliJ
MPFRFRLESILRLRESLEHREELLLQNANQRVAQAQSEIEACIRELQERAVQFQERIAQGAFASELQFELSVDRALESRHNALRADLKKLELFRDQQRERYQKARRERETLAAIRRHELENYRLREQRRTQRAMDEEFLRRRIFNGADKFA